MNLPVACRDSWGVACGAIRRVAQFALIALAFFVSSTVAAEDGPLHVTSKVRIYLNADVTNRDFLPFLTERLEKALLVPVELYNTDVDYSRADRSWRGRYHAESVENLFLRDGISLEPYATEIMLIGGDIYMPPDDWNFSTMFWWEEKNRYRTMIVSLRRLVPDEPFYPDTTRAFITADRLYKIILKSTAFMSGLKAEGCLHQYPRSVAELDLLPSTFCSKEEKRLVDAGLLRD